MAAQQGEWSLLSARQENISVSQGAHNIMSVILVERKPTGSQNVSTHL